MAVKAKIGVLVMALLEDDYNKTAHMRPAATAAAREIADALAAYDAAYERYNRVFEALRPEFERFAGAPARLATPPDPRQSTPRTTRRPTTNEEANRWR